MLKSPHLVSFEELDIVGIAISKVMHEQNHVGILLIDEDKEVKILHFGRHNALSYEEPEDSYCWLDLGDAYSFRDKVALQTTLWDFIKSVGQNLPYISFEYGFDDVEPIIGADGAILDGKAGAALTCATFVLSVFESLALSMLKTEEWPINDETNMKWQKNIMDLLKRYGVITGETYSNQIDKIGSRRYRPEEVAASSQLDRPASYERVIPLAVTIDAQLPPPVAVA